MASYKQIRRWLAALLADDDFVSDVAATVAFGTNHVERVRERLAVVLPVLAYYMEGEFAALADGPVTNATEGDS